MGELALNIVQNEYSPRECVFLHKIDSIIELSIKEIAIKRNSHDFIDDEDEEDSYPFFITDIVEIKYFDLNVYINLEFYNDGTMIQFVDAQDDNDLLCNILASDIESRLIKYYDKDNVNTYNSYKQSLEILHDQNDPFNIRPNMRNWSINKNKYRVHIESICEKITEDELDFLFKYGSAGRHLKLKKGVSDPKVVDIMLPIIDLNVFPQRNKSDYSYMDKARYIVSIFDNLNVNNINKRISDYYAVRS